MQIFKRSKPYKTQFQNTSARKAQQQTGSECKGFKSGDSGETLMRSPFKTAFLSKSQQHHSIFLQHRPEGAPAQPFQDLKTEYSSTGT